MVKRCIEVFFFFKFFSGACDGRGELVNLGDIFVCVYNIGPPDIDLIHNVYVWLSVCVCLVGSLHYEVLVTRWHLISCLPSRELFDVVLLLFRYVVLTGRLCGFLHSGLSGVW